MTVKIWFKDNHTDIIYFEDQEDLARRMARMMTTYPGVKKTKLISKD